MYRSRLDEVEVHAVTFSRWRGLSRSASCSFTAVRLLLLSGTAVFVRFEGTYRSQSSVKNHGGRSCRPREAPWQIVAASGIQAGEVLWCGQAAPGHEGAGRTWSTRWLSPPPKLSSQLPTTTRQKAAHWLDPFQTPGMRTPPRRSATHSDPIRARN
ncbi:hypothetical protein VTK73DRAFT_4053 [Phialemonium thermophilum]|uniref:Uncharacterized protein n=1 Tax=Phialemonium thermophilum TaxID=223376 RepID=A0ABR3VCG0_9PEZI